MQPTLILAMQHTYPQPQLLQPLIKAAMRLINNQAIQHNHQSEYSATTYRPPGFTVKSDSAANASNTDPPERGIVSRKHPRLNPSSPFPSEEDTIESSISDRDRRDLSESKDYFSDEAEDESPPTKKRIAPHKHTVKILNPVTEKPLKNEKRKGKFPSPIIFLQRWMM